jgi:hypothetical protein
VIALVPALLKAYVTRQISPEIRLKWRIFQVRG